MVLDKRYLIVVIPIIILLSYIVIIGQSRSNMDVIEEYGVYDISFLERHLDKYKDNWRNLNDKEIKSLSNLGRILYLNETPPEINDRQEKYKILMWKYGPLLEDHLLYHFEKTKHDPFEDCSATNCILTYNDTDLDTADIVLVHLHSTYSINDLPPGGNRNSNQIWAFFTDESPYHTLLQSRSKMREHNGLFNWSMTYRMDAEIPTPYGRTIIKDSNEEFVLETEFKNWLDSKRKDVLAAILGSNCSPKNRRWHYVRQLKKYMKVDAYGKCGTLKCPGHIDSDCKELDKYMFYLAFENSNCDDYLTEKLWWNAYHKNSIPIIMGPTNNNLEKLLPHHSYINAKDFSNPKDLADFLIHLNNTPTELATYLAWKSKYKILNEHGYFKSNSYYYCRVCEAMNYNSKEYKVYNDLEKYWGLHDCQPSWDNRI